MVSIPKKTRHTFEDQHLFISHRCPKSPLYQLFHQHECAAPFFTYSLRRNSGRTAHPVGQKEANELGLYDMNGNTFEWCWDWYVKEYYQQSPAENPQGPPRPKVDNQWDLVRVRSSSSSTERPDYIRTTTRSYDSPTYPGSNGFRLVRAA